MAQYDLKVLQTKSSMVRDFVTKVSMIMKDLISLSDKCITINDNKSTLKRKPSSDEEGGKDVSL